MATTHYSNSLKKNTAMRNIGPLLTANLAKQIILCSQLQPNLSVFFIDKERKLPQSSVIFIFLFSPLLE